MIAGTLPAQAALTNSLTRFDPAPLKNKADYWPLSWGGLA